MCREYNNGNDNPEPNKYGLLCKEMSISIMSNERRYEWITLISSRHNETSRASRRHTYSIANYRAWIGTSLFCQSRPEGFSVRDITYQHEITYVETAPDTRYFVMFWLHSYECVYLGITW